MRRILNSYISCEVTQSACCEKTKDAFVRFAKLWFTKILVAIETEGFTKQKMMFWVNVLKFLTENINKIINVSIVMPTFHKLNRRKFVHFVGTPIKNLKKINWCVNRDYKVKLFSAKKAYYNT